MERLKFILACMAISISASAQVLESEGLSVRVDSLDGHICSFYNNGRDVQFRGDEWIYGPGFEGVTLRPDGALRWAGDKGPLTFAIEYAVSGGGSREPAHLTVMASITNNSDTTYVTPLRERFRMGVNSQMMSYPQWDWAWFPTMMRCEKSFAWGYFGSTLGENLVFATEEPVASYALNYIYEGQKDWMWGHHIYSACLDLLHCGPLPERHPRNLDRIDAGQTLTWNIHMGVVPNRGNIQACVNRWAGVPQISCDAYTVEAGQNIKISLLGAGGVTVTWPDGKARKFRADRNGTVVLKKLKKLGLYNIEAVSAEGKMVRACVYVRPDREWYLRSVRNYIADIDLPRMGNACEQYYGYYPAFKTAAEFPDHRRDSLLEDRFIRQIPAAVDTATGIPREEALPGRLQNFSTFAGQLVDLWRVTGKKQYLVIAGRIGDYLCTMQEEDGSYRRPHGDIKIHYTAVIYPAKSMFDLAAAEREAGMTEAADRHETSAMRACEDLLARLDNIDTEGDLTFEDGMITCSALQMAYAALHCPEGSAQRRAFTAAAEKMMAKHCCLEQLVIPDCRMHGCTERFWEALDIYFLPNQVVQSPHGWTAWKLFAVYYLYRLTGDEKWRRDFLDTIGACLQLMELNGRLRWGFLCDPYVDALVCVPSDNEKGYEQVPRIIGEQYMPQISPWLRPEDEYGMAYFENRGGAGDGTVYEIFNVLAECPIK